MFTGIVTTMGRIRAVETGRDARRFEVEHAYNPAGIAIGASIAHAGCCLTVVEKGPCGEGGWHAVEVSNESLSKTTLGAWAQGHRVNLERSLKAGDELGGHLVAGHVDGVGEVVSVSPDQGSHRLAIRAPDALSPLIAAKGSIAVDGVSLTVNAVQGAVFELNIIPHTWEVTTLGQLAPGSRVNLEADLVARYVARLAEGPLAKAAAAV